MKRVIGLVFVFFTLVLLLNLVSASVEIGTGNAIIKDYVIGDRLQGVINLNITNEAVDGKLKFIFEENSVEKKSVEITLKDFLKAYDNHEDVIYTCDPVGCGDDFVIDGESEDSKTFSLIPGTNKTIGFIINGNDVEILDDGFTLDVTSDVGNSCVSQLSVDIASDKTADWENSKRLTAQSCDPKKVSTCYEESSFDNWDLIGDVPYCERITIGKGPAFKISALMKKGAGASFDNKKPLIATIYGPDKVEKGNCELSEPTASGSEGICIIDYVSKSNEEHFVCVSTKAGINNEGYSLKARGTGEFCGFLGDPGQVSTNSADYAITVSPRKYDAVGKITLADTSIEAQTGSPLDAAINDYLTDRYDNDCPPSGCIIPITLSGIAQEIIIDNVEIKYKNSASNQRTWLKTALLIGTAGKANSDEFLALDLSENKIDLPQIPKNYTLKIYFGNEKLLEKNITLKRTEDTLIDQIHPRSAPALAQTKFIVFVDKSLNISELEFEWNFGRAPIRSTEPYIVSSILALGNNKVKVSAYKGLEKVGEAEFNVVGVSPKEAVNKTLLDYKTRLTELDTQKSALPTDYQTSLESIFSLSAASNKIREIEAQYLSLSQSETTDDQVYFDIFNNLLNERIPRSIKPSSTSDVEFLYDFNDLDVNDFSILFGQTYSPSQEEEYKSAMFGWFVENVNAKINHKTYSVYFDDISEAFVSEFEVIITPNSGLVGTGYLVIDRDGSDLDFSSDVVPVSHSGITGISMDLSQTKIIKFSLAEEIDSFSLPMYFSPDFSLININEPYVPSNPGGLGFWPKFLMGFLIVAIIVIGGFIIIKKWYSKNYEKSLFKNPNDLYNITQFIKNSKAKGMKDDKIKENLIKAKWKKEQVTYAFKKYYGKEMFKSNKVDKTAQKRLAKI